MNKIIQIICLFLFSINICNFETTPKKEIYFDSSKNTSAIKSCKDDHDLSFDFGESIIINDSLFDFIAFDNSSSICDLTSNYKGCLITRKSDHEFSISLNLPSEDSIIEFTSVGSHTITKKLYISKNNNFYGISLRSLYYSRYLVGYTNDKDYQNTEFLSNQNLIKKVSTQENEFGTIYGYLTWTDDNNLKHPLVDAKVTILSSTTSFSKKTYTDSNGYYEFVNFDKLFLFNNGVVTINISTQNDLVEMLIDEENPYVYTNSFNYLNYRNYNKSFTFTTEDELGQAMDTFSAINAFAQYAKKQFDLYDLPLCKIKYDECNNSYYDNVDTIYLSTYARDAKNIVPTRYESWDLIGHEYGHHLQLNYFDQQYYGNHYARQSDFVTYMTENPSASKKDAKEKAMGLAWKEAWPTFFSITAQATFSDNFKTINFVGDSIYTAHNDVVFDLGEYNSLYYNNDMCEETIMMFMYQLWDNVVDVNDSISISDVILFSVMNDYNPPYFYSFINCLVNTLKSSGELSNLGALLEEFNLGVSDLNITFSDEGIPTFTWTNNRYRLYVQNQSYLFGTRKLSLIFLNSSYKQIYAIDEYYGTSYTFNKSDWMTIFNKLNKSYYLYIKAYDDFTSDLTTGPYYTRYYEFKNGEFVNDFKIPIDFENSIVSKK